MKNHRPSDCGLQNSVIAPSPTSNYVDISCRLGFAVAFYHHFALQLREFDFRADPTLTAMAASSSSAGPTASGSADGHFQRLRLLEKHMLKFFLYK